MPRITEVYAFIACDTGEDDEGIVSWKGPPPFGMLPMVGGDMQRTESLRPYAQSIANATGKPVRIYKFTGREQIGEIRPRRTVSHEN